MKKYLFILLAIVVTTITSCSKDAKINRRIDGEWQVKTIGGSPLGSDESYVFKFIKDKKLTGDGTVTYTDDFDSDVEPFTYSVSDQKITFVFNGYAEVLTVLKYEKEKLELMDFDGEVWTLEKK